MNPDLPVAINNATTNYLNGYIKTIAVTPISISRI